MSNALSPQWIKAIKAEHQRLMDDEEHLHNNLMHDRIREVWQRDSPKMWARLSMAGLTTPLAYVLQARMWDRQAELIRGGMPVTDAREVAERELLMLEPEAEASGDRLADLQNLPASLT